MCRWLAYSGSPLNLGTVLFDPAHSIVDQSLHAREGVETTNGDGFGVGWYSDGMATPGRYRSISPAWNDANLKDIARHIDSRMIFSHIRAATGTAVQSTNCHPFRNGRWMFMHNGTIEGHHNMRRDLTFQVAPSLFNDISGSTDSELLFYLALTEQLEDDPIAAMERAVGAVETMAADRGIAEPVQLSAAVTDGETVWAFRYSTVHDSRTLYVSEDLDTVFAMYPDLRMRARYVPSDARFVVSEPFTRDLPGAWLAVPESTALVVRRGKEVEYHEFHPAHVMHA